MNLLPFAIKNSTLITASVYPVSKKTGIFTTIKIKHTVPLFLEMHLKRLHVKNKKKFVIEQIQKLLDTNKILDCAVRITVLKNRDMYFHARELPKNEKFSAITYALEKKLPTIKQIDRSIYERACKKALENHAQEVIFVHKNFLLETTIANLISIENGQLITPELTTQGLKGIARQVLLNSGFVIEKNIPILTEQPLVAVNSLRVMQIEKLNSRKLPNAYPLYLQVSKILRKAEEEYENSYNR